MYLNASAIGETSVASTHHGYHYRVKIDCPRETAMQLRKMLGDDKNRIAFEELELRRGITDWCDTLFVIKLGKDGKWHFEEKVNNVLCLPFHSKVKHIKVLPIARKKRKT